METIDRKEYIKEYHDMAGKLIFNEKLPLINDILDFATKGKTNDRLQHVFDFFGDEDELRGLVTRESVRFSEDESDEFISSVIAANVSDISESGLIYKQLQATGDTYRIRGKDCKSVGRKVELPLTEEEFIYNVRNCYFTLEKGSQDYLVFSEYDKFTKDMEDVGAKEIWVRSPMTCKNHTRKGCCPICAGELPKGVQNIGAFTTLMVTETATQAALSSMNKGRKANVNFLLTQRAVGEDGKPINSHKAFYEWCEGILQELQGDSVERRFYEVALLGRLRVDDKKVSVASLANPNSSNLFGEFIYRPKESTFKKMLNKGVFNDNSLKTQIALNNYRKGLF